ncbi:MAG: pilus assembly protein PilY [Gammaproteobacteria bacterium]|nr:pilus assembly protein PilY [Gammaproteobacteria bacterium]
MNSLKRKAFGLAALIVSALPAWTVIAAPAQVPLFLGGSIEPNVMFTLDDSGSMHYEMMPDSLIWSYFIFPRANDVYGTDDYYNYVVSFTQTNNIYDKWVRSSAINKIYYNPAITYRPWSNSDGSSMGNASITCAPHNPVKTARGCRNLTVNNTQSAYWDRYTNAADFGDVGTYNNYAYDGSNNKTFWPSFYYQFTGDINSTASKENAANYTRVEIKSANAPFTGSTERSDCAAAPTCTYAEEIQNFANWYTYYRSRILLARAGVGRAFAEQGTGLRVGFAAINKGSATVDSVSSPGALINGVRKFTGSDRTAFFDSLYTHSIPTEGTPLRRALDNVGQYFSRTDNRGPWGAQPGSNDSTAHLACRQSYNILMTDGYWNGAGAPTSTGSVNATNADNKSGPSITGPDNQSYKYTPANPYQGLDEDTLADVAMYYWNRDLRTDLDNLVPTNPADEAFWQHLVNFTVGLGVMGTLDPATDLPLLTAGTKQWPTPSGTGAEENIDDLWHAAVNSRGGFFSAADPEEFAEQLSATLQQIIGRTGSAAAIATNSTRLNADTYVYQARFDSKDWRGELLGFKVDGTTGAIIDADTSTTALDPTWEAAKLLDTKSALAYNVRNIFTHEAADSDGDGEVGVDLLWDATHTPPASIMTAIKHGDSDTVGQRRLNFIRGDDTYEIGNDPAGTFRKRVSVLGDIVNSDPFFVGQQDYGFNILPGTEGSSYITYRSSNAYKNRPGVVYVGVNDGMLHAFREDTGYELFAFIPEAVQADLWKLSDPDYSHQFYVDGPSAGKDAYINNTWKSVLLGTTGAGGKSVFALDVTDPENFSKSDVMWEFSTDDDDADTDGTPDGDLGYTIGQPTLARMANGAWAAVFGNGYSSTNNRAVLFIVDVATGALIRKIDTGVGDGSSPNGLATPILVDYNNDKIADRAYAGDLLGNMWAFDLSDTSDTSKWEVDYQSSGSPAPLFVAKDEDGTTQPITSKPEVTNHPTGGVMIFFGTGKYFESGDGTVKRKNSFYGIWDDFNATTPAPVSGGRSSLLQQQITHETYTDSSGDSWLSDGTTDTANPFPWDLRVTTENTISWTTHKGWYIDLESPLLGWEGERVVSTPLLRDGRVIFSTSIPSLDPCEYGGTSWLMELSSVDGSRLSVSPFDLNGDGAFNEGDYVEIWVNVNGVDVKIKVPTSGKKSKVGITKTPAVIKTKEKEFKFTSGSSGEIEQTLESLSYRDGRQSWRQLR